MATKHVFDSETEVCIHCGAAFADAQSGEGIGCEAGPEGNPPSYAGFALTPAEQAQGITTADKARALYDESSR